MTSAVLFGLVSTAFRAIEYPFPVPRPFFAPTEGACAVYADLGGEFGFLTHDPPLTASLVASAWRPSIHARESVVFDG